MSGLVCVCSNQSSNFNNESRTLKSGLFSFSGSVAGSIIDQTVIATDENYDARDQFNQPVVAPAAKQTLRVLFVTNLYNMLNKTQVYTASKALEIIYTKLNLLAVAITKPFRFIVQQMLAVFTSPQFRKLLKIFFCTLLFALIVCKSKFSLLTFHNTSLAKVAPLVMRC